MESQGNDSLVSFDTNIISFSILALPKNIIYHCDDDKYG